MDIKETINACSLDSGLVTLALYSHLVPIFFSLGLSLLVFFKAKKSIFSRAFLAFSVVFSLWLIGDLITWVSNNYHLIYAAWSTLVYLEILFYVLGLYFVFVFVRRTDITFITKVLLFVATLVPFYLTITNSSVLGFNYPVCEAFNNISLDSYKLYIEVLILLIMLFYVFLPFFKKRISYDKKSSVIILGSIFLFLSVFGVTEYLAALTGNYEMHLYSLFVIPIFLIAITYAIFNLDVFNLKIVSTYFLVFGFLILTGSQLLFVTDSTDRFLTALTLVLSVVLMIFLFKNLHKESEQRIHIEKLSEELFEANDKLKGLDKLKTEFLSLASHQLRSPLTAINGYVSMLLAGDFGEVNDKQKDTISRVYESS
ncbi:MAG: hypothetical protein QG644_506, partial [Patescibacteria group bacterium]|nr:hypothetical protein [Patescibacteria group bacterium]